MENPQVKTKASGSLIGIAFALFAAIVFGVLWLFFIAPAEQSGFGWYLFSFATGLTMIVLPCTLPLAFVIVPLSMGKGVRKGLGIALSFGLGVAITLSLYGVAAAIVGKTAIGSLGAPLEVVKNWVYFIAGIFAYLFALGEIGLIKFRMPSYTGAAPAFIQKQGDFFKALLLGLFLGNIGVGCPHPATPLLLVEIASSGNIFYGWSLFLVHAIGRILPLLLLAILGIAGVNGLSWLVARKDKIEKATGWAMVFVAGFILTLGLFSHGWWVNSGIHTQLEKVTQEETLLSLINSRLGTHTVHHHGIDTGSGLFGLPLTLGNWFLVLLWVIPFWWWYNKEKKRIKNIPESNQIPEKLEGEKNIRTRRAFYITLTLLLALTFIYVLPHNFLKHDALLDHHHDEGAVTDGHTHAEDTTMMESGMMMGHTHHASYAEEGTATSGPSILLETKYPLETGASSSIAFIASLLPQHTAIESFDIDHEKEMHLIGVRDDLTNFFHIHPEKTAFGKWSVDYAFKEPGLYKLWTDVSYQGQHYAFGHHIIPVLDKKLAKEERFTTTTLARVASVEILKNIIVDNAYQVNLDYPDPIVMGRDTLLHFKISTLKGSGVTLEPYLGTSMHLAVIKDDMTRYIHTHPESEMGDMNSGSPVDSHTNGQHLDFVSRAYAHGDEEGATEVAKTDIHFIVNFPEAGTYKLFAQFRPTGTTLLEDQSLVGEFYVKVLENGPAYQIADTDNHVAASPPLPKWVMTTLSLVLILILGAAVRRFIKAS